MIREVAIRKACVVVVGGLVWKQRVRKPSSRKGCNI
jgi:hypothetical protein